MQMISLTPFGRQPVSAGLILARTAPVDTPAPLQIDKWALFDDLRSARADFGVSDRDLAVLHALLSFLPGKALTAEADLVVFPSNASLSDRAHGMAESTLRRHLAALVRAGLIWRQDSPNGKRYAARDRSGALIHAFGFDLRPLLQRASEIGQCAARVQAAQRALVRQRELLVLRLRDAAKLLAYGRGEGLPGDWDAREAEVSALRAALRRRMDAESLSGLLDRAGQLLATIRHCLAIEAGETGGTAAHSGRHHTESNQDSSESEPCPEEGRAPGRAECDPDAAEPPAIPLHLVVKACPDILPYARSRLDSWRDFVAVVAELRGMMGISASAWSEAQRVMGPEVAAIAVAGILQRFTAINNPGGYLRALTLRAASGAFSPGPMIMALLNSAERRAA